MEKRFSEDDDIKNFPIGFFVGVSIIVAIVGAFLFLNIRNVINYYYNLLKGNDLSTVGQFGDFIGGFIGTIFSIVGIFLLYITLQRQSQGFKRERFENRFFEMIKIYRDNISEMHYLSPQEEIKTDITQGRKVFVKINSEYISLFYRLSDFSRRNSIKFEKDYDLPSITFLVVFFGLDKSGYTMLRSILFKEGYVDRYPLLIDYIYKTLSKLTANYVKKNVGEKKIKYYGGNQVRLGHFFRHFYQAVNYVHGQEFLTRQEKYDYIKLLRGQMSTYEQAVFFYNSLSPMGRVWELNKRDLYYNRTRKKDGEFYKIEELFITEYRLIKNIPDGFTGPLKPRDFYGQLRFEGDA